MKYIFGRGFLTTDGDIWNHSRRLLKPTFEKRNLLDLSVLGGQLDVLFGKIPDGGGMVDLQPLLSDMFLATSMDFLLGVLPTDKAYTAPHSPQTFTKAFHEAILSTMFRIMLGKLWVLAPKSAYIRNTKISHEFVEACIDEALSNRQKKSFDSRGVQKRSMIKSLSDQTDDREHIRNQILQGMLASGETISELLGNTILLLSKHLPYWEQIRELAEARKDDLEDFDFLHDCELIQNILREALRLYPVFPIMARIALQNTTLPTGGGPNQTSPIFVPKGSMVVMSYYALHRDTSIFGNDIEDFRPERWNDIHPDQFEFVPFGVGQRACLGMHKVMVEAAYVLLRMAGRYRGLRCRDEKEWEGELMLTCKSKSGCQVSLQKA